METLVKDEIKPHVQITVEATAGPADSEKSSIDSPDRHKEIHHLLRIKQSRQIEVDRMPCPCCRVLVEIATSRCPFCESDITAETALARETTRRLREISGELDTEHATRTKAVEPRRGFFRRLKYLFEGDPKPTPADTPAVDPHAKRLLNFLSPGDSLKVLEEEGPWLKVKTMAGAIGWVYSTVRKAT